MDGDFQQQYQNAERAYGLGDYTESHRLASGLLEPVSYTHLTLPTSRSV